MTIEVRPDTSAMLADVAELSVQDVDPRDTGWEIDLPAYRVHFWRSVSIKGHSSREVEVRGAADVSAVLTWAAGAAERDEIVVVYALVPGDPPGLVRLLGDDPTSNGVP